MKVAAIVLAASVALVSAQDCDMSKLTPLLTSPNKKACEDETGYKLISLAPPSADLAPKVCANAGCKALLDEIDKAFPTDCVAMDVKVRSTILEPTKKACAAPAPGPATTAPAATSKTPAATSAAPATTSATPAATSKTPASTSKAPEASTHAPAKNGTTSGSHAGSHHSDHQEPEAGEASHGSAGEIETPKDQEPTVTAPAPVAKPKPTTAAPKSGASTIAVAAGALFAAVAASLF
ncbi:hypothetical protein PINS_up010395 [Pythium insidiosum]|nr:hypothetical protein PINS_up010395 [Pythium insidiosum]